MRQSACHPEVRGTRAAGTPRIWRRLTTNADASDYLSMTIRGFHGVNNYSLTATLDAVAACKRFDEHDGARDRADAEQDGHEHPRRGPLGRRGLSEQQ